MKIYKASKETYSKGRMKHSLKTQTHPFCNHKSSEIPKPMNVQECCF